MTTDVEAGKPIVKYGTVSDDDEDTVNRKCLRGNTMIVYLSSLKKWCDGRQSKSLGRFVNFACECVCNCCFYVERNKETTEYECWIVAKEFIPANSELTWDYGYRYEHYRDKNDKSMTWLRSYECDNGEDCIYWADWFCNTAAGKASMARNKH